MDKDSERVKVHVCVRRELCNVKERRKQMKGKEKIMESRNTRKGDRKEAG